MEIEVRVFVLMWWNMSKMIKYRMILTNRETLIFIIIFIRAQGSD